MLTTRHFGFEFEHISSLAHSSFQRELVAAEVPVDPYATGLVRCSEGCYSGWQVKSDGSISPGGDYPYGIELVSPPITLKQTKQVHAALAVARKFGKVNTSCGLHIHVHAPELSRLYDNVGTQNNVSAVWLGVEKILFTYMPPSRRMSDYCRGGISWGTKYQAFNTTPLGNPNRTVEFRLHNATLEPEKAIVFAAICIGLVERMIAPTVLPEIDPAEFSNVPPKLIRTRRGGEFYLLRNDRKWIIESKKITAQVDSLAAAFKQYSKDLSLTGPTYLSAFHYPHHGNAMSRLCEYLGVNGVFRGYAEDRYERMLNKHGLASGVPGVDSIVDDEEDYYNEPDYEELDQAA